MLKNTINHLQERKTQTQKNNKKKLPSNQNVLKT